MHEVIPRVKYFKVSVSARLLVTLSRNQAKYIHVYYIYYISVHT